MFEYVENSFTDENCLGQNLSKFLQILNGTSAVMVSYATNGKCLASGKNPPEKILWKSKAFSAGVAFAFSKLWKNVGYVESEAAKQHCQKTQDASCSRVWHVEKL